MSFGNTPTTTTQGALPTNQIPLGEVYVPEHTNGDAVALQGGPSSTDSHGNESAPIATYTPDGNDLTQGKSTDANTANTVIGRLTKIRDLLLSVLSFNLVDSAGTNKASVSSGGAVKVDNSSVTQPVSGTFFQATQPVSATSLPLPSGAAIEAGHLATIDTSTAASKTDLDTIVTNTNKIPASPATEGGNLATLAGIVSSSKAAVKAASGDFVDGSIVGIGTTTQTKATDGTTTSWSVIQLLKGIFDKLLGSLAVTGTFWQATQPVSGTITANEGGTWTVQPGNTANTTPWLVQEQAGTAGGSTPYHLLSAANNNATSLKASAGQLYGYSFSNTNAAARWVKFYNKASAPAPATDTVVWAEQVPGNGTVIATIPEGMVFATGIAFAAVVNASDTDNTSVGAGDLSIDIRYK